MRANEIYIAFILSEHFLPAATKEVAMLFAERAERFYQTPMCMELIEKYGNDADISMFRRRLMNMGILAQDKEGDE